MAPPVGSDTPMVDEHSRLLTTSADPENVVPGDVSTASLMDDGQASQVPARITKRLYTSHFLSTWNTRVFEFGAVLYLASVFPGTLLPMSVYALTRGTSAILFSSAVGQYIDTGNRLQVVRISIGNGLPQLFWFSTLICAQCCPNSSAATRRSCVVRDLLSPRHRPSCCLRRENRSVGASGVTGLCRKIVRYYEPCVC
jgi:hypothetical protein